MSAESEVTAAEAGREQQVEILESRVLMRWDALKSGQIADAYALELPSYRALYDLARFAETAPSGDLKPTAAEIRDIELDGTRARVVLEVHSLVTLPPPTGRRPMISSQQEIWLERDGEWWHAPTFVAMSEPRVPSDMDAGGDAVHAESRDD
ncbi:MAG: hypothetical protein KFB96_19560 [Thiocapsa sp.]|uniref:hypothetical protein n=1 Tax=Thiocapsa sp. TaxID=2024551 RepID=UPI001BCB309F|nr:hypothetical protein [Thiocapsa sp.]QVL47848.1 MAG: hypothetical protein KFB96_19560 [Thiocapsa sp.]